MSTLYNIRLPRLLDECQLVPLVFAIPYLFRLFISVVFIIIFFGTWIHFTEPDRFPTIFDGIWWAIITTSTIGYGDYVPGTVQGKLIGILLVFIGAGLVAAYFVAIASATIKKYSGIMKGTIKVDLKNHFIIVGWNERTKEILRAFNAVNSDQSVVLIDSDLEVSPFSTEKNKLFVKGNASSDQTLRQANIGEARMILVTADPRKTELAADMYTILTIVAIKGVALIFTVLRKF